MDKKTKKELERLQRLNSTERNFLNGIYGDMFGNSGSVSSDQKKEPTAAELLNEAQKKRETNTSGAYKDAESALKEVQDLIANTDEFIQSSLQNLPGIEKDQSFSGEETQAQGGTVSEDKKNIQHTDTHIESGNTSDEAEEKEPETDPMEELDKLIGLSTIKHDVRELTAFVKMQKLRSESGLKSVPISLHLVFTGNPGTGKTTVARIIAKLYKQIGVLSKGQLVEVDRSGLVAGYVGQTALKTQDQIKKALGGVLFIDEAYALAQKDDAFGQEAIDTILKAMEDHRDDLVVIVAGYTGPMEKFIASNPGLKSRFNKYIDFPDYTTDELEQIFYMNCSKYDYTVEEEAKKHIREMIVSRRMRSPENFANAREIRNMFEEIITNQARRVSLIESPSQEDFITIKMEDLTEQLTEGQVELKDAKCLEPAKESSAEVILDRDETLDEE